MYMIYLDELLMVRCIHDLQICHVHVAIKKILPQHFERLRDVMTKDNKYFSFYYKSV